MFNIFKKKDKGRYPRTFAKRLTWRIMITLFIVMSIVSLIIYGISQVTVLVQAYTLSNRILAAKCLRVEQVLSEVYVASVNTVPDIENTLNRPDRIAQVMKRIVELNPNIRSCGISFRENYYPQKGARFCPYAVRSDSDSVIVMSTTGESGQDYLKAEWFTHAMKAPDGFWSKPFFAGKEHETPLVAYLLPIRDSNGSTVAVLGVDVSLEKLAKENLKENLYRAENNKDSRRHNDEEPDKDYDKATKWDAQYEMYFFIIGPDGTFLMHPDYKRIGHENFYTYADATPDTLDNHLGHIMRTQVRGHISELDGEDMTIENEKVLVSYQPLAHTPWTMALVVPQLFVDVISYLLAGGMLFFLFIGLVVVFFAGRRGIKKASEPLRKLAASADEVAKGNFNTPLPDIHSRDEIHLVRDSFANMQQSLVSYMNELRETTAQKASMESELKIAHDIQMSMLPKTFPPYPERDDLSIFGSLTPAKAVGGDLFDFYIRDEKLFFCIGDVSGKGVPASLYMAVTRSLFRNVSAHVAEPELIVSALNNAQSEGNDSNMFVTIFIGVLELSTGLLRYCNAGHDSPLLIGRSVGTLPCDSNLPIGIISGYEFKQQEVLIDPMTTIFLFTDGLTEAENSSHAQFGDSRISRLANDLLSLRQHQPDSLIAKMTEAVHQFVGNAEQSDDLTMLAIQFKGTAL
jgi:sigma-B regulation protein RsbU (phosphoserine phosphatase)